MRRWGSTLSVALFALAAFAAAGGAALSCSTGESTAPLGHGDTLIVDVEASAGQTTSPTATDADLDPDGIFDPLDSSSIYGNGNYDAAQYAVLRICLPPDASASSKDGGKASKDAGVTSEPVEASAGSPDASAGGTGVVYTDAGYVVGDAGCVDFPSSCDPTAQPSPCSCLLGAFAADVPCTYPHCEDNSDKSGYTMYCPP
jgi:hypothetical protein